MVREQALSFASYIHRRTQPSVSLSSARHVSELALKWEAPSDSLHDGLSFLRRNRTDSLLCTASSTPPIRHPHLFLGHRRQERSASISIP